MTTNDIVSAWNAGTINQAEAISMVAEQSDNIETLPLPNEIKEAATRLRVAILAGETSVIESCCRIPAGVAQR